MTALLLTWISPRSHMYNVQKDLAALRQKVLEAEMALQKNEKVQKLEEDCEWCVCTRIVATNTRGGWGCRGDASQEGGPYVSSSSGLIVLDGQSHVYMWALYIRYRSEAIRLDGFATAMKKDLKYMKDKLEVLGKATPISGPQ